MFGNIKELYIMKTTIASDESKIGYLDIPINKLVKADWNYKLNDDELHNKLLENFKRNGQIENIIVRELDTGFFEIINGNHRLGVMKELNMKKVHCFNFGKISLTQAQRIAIEVNETRFRNDEFALGRLFKEIQEEYDMDDLLKTLPFSDKEISDYMSILDLPEYEVTEPIETNKSKEVICPNCGYKFTPKEGEG